MLVLLHGAKRNVGDFLIKARAEALVAAILPRQQITVLPRWEPLPDSTAAVADGIILAGGPGLAAHFHPGVFPLVPDLAKVDIPILPLALGWSGRPRGAPEDFAFDSSSRTALEVIHRRIGWSSVRDVLSLGVMERAEVGETRMTGCVAWYDLQRLGQPVDPPREIRDLVVTTPAALWLVPQCISLMRTLARRFPDARRRCVFHRGIGHGAHTSRAATIGATAVARGARAAGFEVVDGSGDVERIAFYADADLHVGYRVHAHLAFLAARRPSLLLEEDGRGAGQAATLHPRVRLDVKGGAVKAAMAAVEAELHDDFPVLRGAVAMIEATAPLMRETIEQLA